MCEVSVKYNESMQFPELIYYGNEPRTRTTNMALAKDQINPVEYQVCPASSPYFQKSPDPMILHYCAPGKFPHACVQDRGQKEVRRPLRKATAGRQPGHWDPQSHVSHLGLRIQDSFHGCTDPFCLLSSRTPTFRPGCWACPQSQDWRPQAQWKSKLGSHTAQGPNLSLPRNTWCSRRVSGTREH